MVKTASVTRYICTLRMVKIKIISVPLHTCALWLVKIKTTSVTPYTCTLRIVKTKIISVPLHTCALLMVKIKLLLYVKILIHLLKLGFKFILMSA